MKNGFDFGQSPFAPTGNNPLGTNGNWPQNPTIPWSENTGKQFTIFTPGTSPNGTVTLGQFYISGAYVSLPASPATKFRVITPAGQNDYPFAGFTFYPYNDTYCYKTVNINGAAFYVAPSGSPNSLAIL